VGVVCELAKRETTIHSFIHSFIRGKQETNMSRTNDNNTPVQLVGVATSQPKSAVQLRPMVVAFWRTIAIATIVLQPTGILDVGFVTPLAARPRTTNHHPHDPLLSSRRNNSNNNNNKNSHRLLLHRRQVFSGVFGSVVATATTLLVPGVASAGIDVSSLKVEANPLDIFLGGTYFEGEDDSANIDGRMSRRKYTIIEAPQTGLTASVSLIPDDGNNINKKKKKKKNIDFFEDLDRPVLIRGESTTISSSRDDAFELKGNLFLCNENGSKGCIVIDFSPLGGSKETRGYWDDTEMGIRFLDSKTIWSKQ